MEKIRYWIMDMNKWIMDKDIDNGFAIKDNFLKWQP